MTTTAPEPRGITAVLVPVDSIVRSSTNPRRTFDEADMAELTDSVRRHGVLQPILVRPKWASQTEPGGYELVAGERRWRAAKEAGLAEIPATVRELTDDDVVEIQVIENLQRSDVHPLEEAAAYRRLLATERYTVQRIAERIGRSAPYVYDRMRLLELVEPAQQLFLDGKITAAHAIILSRLKPSDQERALTPGARALFEPEESLWTLRDMQQEVDDLDEASDEDIDDEEFDEDHEPVSGDSTLRSLKTRTARELQGWVDKHVRFDPTAEDVPTLFPETAATVATAQEEAEKIVSITYEHYVQPTARDGGRIIGPRSWKLADEARGAKLCDHAVTGVIVAGAGRGEAFKVCLEKKKCPTHWGSEMREAQKQAKATAAGGSTKARMEAEQKKRREQEARETAERERYKKALPALQAAIAEALKTAPAHATSPAADLLFGHIKGWGALPKGTPPRGKTAEDLIRYLTGIILLGEVSHVYSGPANMPKVLKPFGIDVKAIVEKAAPAPATAAKEKKAPAGGGKKT